MSSVNRYRLFCITENIFVYMWDTKAPTTCSTDHTHNVDLSTLSILETISQDTVFIQNIVGTTGGQYRCESKSFTIPANSIGNKDCTWPFDISVKSVFFHTSVDQIGDKVKSLVAPNTTIGVIVSNGSAGTNTITVSPTVLAYAQKGYIIRLVNGTNGYAEDIGEITSLSGNVLTLTGNITTTFPAGSYVQMTIMNINIIIGPVGFMRMEAKGSTSSLIPTGTVVRSQYENVSSTPKIFTFHIEYFY